MTMLHIYFLTRIVENITFLLLMYDEKELLLHRVVQLMCLACSRDGAFSDLVSLVCLMELSQDGYLTAK